MCFKLNLTRYQIDFIHVVFSIVLSIGVPLGVYWMLWAFAGFDITPYFYIFTAFMLLVIAIMIVAECLIAYFHPGAPKEAAAPAPPASAIICAYMPNEQHTIMETIEHFLALEYEPGLQVILAYNTPFYCKVEAELSDLADVYPNFHLLKVPNSRSKAENLNTALNHVTGEFVACFDADHMPEPGSFERAWRWLSNGYDVVQGHCLVRNPEESFWAKMIAIEFETIYALAHPGRTVRDGFGIFGGSNGYWKTPLLQQIGMIGTMMTEDIDSSMRVLEEGSKIGTDPLLISRELATTTFMQVWNQRLRWAQGWLQVSIKHVIPMTFNKHFGIQSKFGSFMLLFVRELYPWISVQIIPIIIFAYVRGDKVDWTLELFVSMSVITAIVGPVSVFFAYRLAHPSLQKSSWFIIYGIFSLFFYTELKNVICRVALIKQVFGETGWRVTPRSPSAPAKDPENTSEHVYLDDTARMDVSEYTERGSEYTSFDKTEGDSGSSDKNSSRDSLDPYSEQESSSSDSDDERTHRRERRDHYNTSLGCWITNEIDV
jgi:cellulose synthase/poly-beta-1,6-N-acetylglucosamine synthase-like glycosyltransferase